MNTILKALPLIGLFLLVLVSGCKYEDGPYVSLRTAKSRVANSWKWKKAYDNTRNFTAGDTIGSIVYSQCHLGMDKEERFSISIARKQINGFDVTIERGSWSLTDKNQTIFMDYDNPNIADETWSLTRLTKDELNYKIPLPAIVAGKEDFFRGELVTD